MGLHDDFSKRAAVHSADEPWVASPMPGVDRRMLDRIGEEVARATTIVRYAPGSKFSSHVHTGGEEFLVLDGVFQDEHGDFPTGSYIRNPPESSHTPGSAPGCTIFVKLWQFDLADRTHVRIDTDKMRFMPDRDGVEVMPLFNDTREDVVLERWASGVALDLEAPGGIEILVLEGGFIEAGETFKQHSWLRLPRESTTSVQVSPDGARVWIKRGHLREDPTPPAV
ncbi:cupin domain-containing protein [Roseovarius aestuarii]|uniref:ChrR Cupin-like domain protein n=1 Tax=Roseovarius aestuarii TaxID=475083 RepID=A0A1X7BRL2_9RHOB|nr:cupin domain-containing protein [Roseovarius aestuarii]SMC11829.1 ChrR Cupin-like domain protein [Roseovarius aestuarii]